jgi:hypothetical protein
MIEGCAYGSLWRSEEDFTMKDEAYLMGPSKDSQVLLTTAAPNSMPHAWATRQAVLKEMA